MSDPIEIFVTAPAVVGVSITGGIGPQGSAGGGGSAAATVVNGLTGTITIVGEGISVAAAGTTITLTSLSAVSSVNGKTGVVLLAAVDVTAANAVHLHHANDITAGTIGRDRLPIATTTAIGAVQASSGLSVDGNGQLTSNVRSVAGRTGDITLTGGDVSGVVGSLNSLSGAVAIAGVNITVAAAGTTITLTGSAGSSLTAAQASAINLSLARLVR
jgi:hypothetical protein